MPDQCSTCFFAREYNEQPGVENHYTCRRRSPMPVARNPAGYERAKWPQVCPEDWCAEFSTDGTEYDHLPPIKLAVVAASVDFPIRIVANQPVTIDNDLGINILSGGGLT